jgi:putative exporter of polyketide antibiotics
MLSTLIIQSIATMAEAAENSNAFGAFFLPMVFIVGFLAAAGLGSLAWYNSKRPMGWQDKKRPSFVPKVEKSETPGLGDPNP